MKKLLVIAGSDSMGGAGIQADIKTASSLGIHASTIVTAVTSQNTKGVQSIHFVPLKQIESQFMSIKDDVGFDAVKIGMVGDKKIAELLFNLLKDEGKPVILDPAITAQSGGKLSDSNLFDTLFKIADMVTPNAKEAELLTGMKIDSVKDMENAAKQLRKRAKMVLVKGGDTKIDFDVLAMQDKLVKFPIERIKTQNTHGTGCSLATAIISYYMQGMDFETAVAKGRGFIRTALKAGYSLGEKFGTIDQLAVLRKEAFRYTVLKELYDAYLFLREKEVGFLVPEIQSNLVYILPFGEKHEDVAGFPSRIIRNKDNIFTAFYPEFGVSKHMANVVLAANRYFPEIRAAMNIRYSEEILKVLKAAGFKVSSFDRKKEPKTIREREGSSLDWGVTEACKKLKCCPDAVFDKGDIGKEPVIRIFGLNPQDVANKIIKIKEKMKNVRF